MADEYLSTDPNAGNEGYLSTDPNAGATTAPQTQTLGSQVGEQLGRAGRAIGSTAIGFVKGLPSMAKFIRPPSLTEVLGGAAEVSGQIQQARTAPLGSQEWWNAVVPLASQYGMQIAGVRAASPKLSETLFPEKPPVQSISEAATKEVIGNAIKERQIQEGRVPEYPGDDARRVSAEAGRGGGVEPAAKVQGQAPQVEGGAIAKAPAVPPEQPKIVATAVQTGTESPIRGQTVNEPHDAIGERMGIGKPPEESRKFVVQNPDGTERIVGREEAATVAKGSGQVLPEASDTTALHSEELKPTVQPTADLVLKKSDKTTGFVPDLVKDRPLWRQIQQEAGIPVGEAIKTEDYDKFLKAAGNRGLTIETRDLTKPEGGVSEEVQKVQGEKGREGVLISEPAAVQPPAVPKLPATPAELPDPTNVTAIKNEVVDRERAARGLPSAVEPARKAFGESWDQASKKINDDPNYINNLLQDIRAKPRALTDVEDAALLHRQIDLQNSFDKTSKELVRAQESGDIDSLAENRVRYAQLSDQLLDLYNVGKASGTETGRGLAARKLLANENFTLANMMTQKRAALQGKPLTAEQMSEVEGYNKEILEADRKLADYEKQPKKESARLQAAKTRMEMAKTELERRIAFQDYQKVQRAEPIKLDAEGLKLRADLERKKQQYWQSLTKDRLAQRTLTEKVQDTFTKWRRGFILSSPNVLAKLTSAAAERMAFTPMEEAVGAGLRKVPFVKEAFERAPMEGHPSIRAEAKALTEGFTQGMKDAWKVLRTGRSDLDVQFGKQHVLPPAAIDFIGQIHGALKTIPKRNEFARRFQQGVEQIIENGGDPTDPMVQTRIATQAYKQANRSIFLQDNRVVDAFQRGIARFEQVDPITGRVPPSSKALATGLKVLFPIVKVPTNIVAETLQYSTGLVTGSARLANAFRRGLETVKPEEFDLIARELKKGSLGGAVMLLGYLNADKIGGYYQPGVRRPKEDVGYGKIRVFGVDIPTYLIHNPLLEQAQIGATIKRVAQSKLRKKDTTPQGIPQGILAAALGVTEEVPFVRETLGELPKMYHGNERQQFLGEFAKSLVVPAVVQWSAYQMDKRQGEPVKRQADTILENIESGIPGLRQRLPEKQRKGGVIIK